MSVYYLRIVEWHFVAQHGADNIALVETLLCNAETRSFVLSTH
jgi:hypothetical protein